MDTESSMSGRPYKQNTKHDKIQALKQFYSWLIKRGISHVDPERIKEIRVPERDRHTTRPEELITPDEVRRMIEACKRSRNPTRDRDIIATHYESMARIGEIGRLTWSSLSFDEHGVMMTITDEKTKKLRYVRLVMAAEYLQSHLEESRTRGRDLNGFVFLSERGQPMTYPDFESLYKRVAQRAGIKKRVHSHLMRKSRITELMKKRRQESIIKKMAWGNVTTREWETYAVLCSQDIDDEVLDMYGIKHIQDAGPDPLAPIQCEKCLVINPPTALFCIRCRSPLTEEARAAVLDKEQLAKSDPLYEKLVARQNAMMRDLAIEMGIDPERILSQN